MTIRTLTLSPGFDHLVLVDSLDPGGVARVVAWDTYASGKGVNVSRIANALGAPSVAYSLVGEIDQEDFIDLAGWTHSKIVTVPVPGRTRRNLTLSIEGSGKIASHASGPRISTASDRHADTLVSLLLAQVDSGDIITFNGAVPDGVRAQVWADAAESLRERDVTIVSDAQDEALIALLNTGLVVMAKPNEDEALALQGVDSHVPNGRVVERAIDAMRTLGVLDPMVSQGERGISHLRGGYFTRSWCPVTNPKVAVGAGDAFLAGYCAALSTSRWSNAEPSSLGLATASAHVAQAEMADLVRSVSEALHVVRHEAASE